jgi:hypothetical protein
VAAATVEGEGSADDTSLVRLTTIPEEAHRLGLGDEVSITLGNGVDHERVVSGTVTEVRDCRPYWYLLRCRNLIRNAYCLLGAGHAPMQRAHIVEGSCERERGRGGWYRDDTEGTCV